MADDSIGGSSSDLPRVLILGGVGFIGRNLVQFLINNDLVSKVQVVDKVPPQTAWLNEAHKDVFSNHKVEYKSANLINPSSVENAFNSSDGENFDYVINLAAETKLGQTDPVYKEGILKLSLTCAKEAAKRHAKCYIEVSTGQIYSAEKTPMKEDTKTDPWTNIAKFKLQVEEELKNITGLNYIIVRPAIVYGIGDKTGLTPRLVVAGVYKHLQEKMKLLWTKDLKMNTVHVLDVCRSLWHVCNHGKLGEVYNVVDKGDTTQGKVTDYLSEIFNINHDYVGALMSNLSKLNMTSIVEDINDKHMAPWAEACLKDGIINTPLNPYLDQELLFNKNIYMDGSKIEETGFKYLKPEITKDLLLEVLDDYIKMGLFPASLTT